MGGLSANANFKSLKLRSLSKSRGVLANGFQEKETPPPHLAKFTLRHTSELHLSGLYNMKLIFRVDFLQIQREATQLSSSTRVLQW